MTSPRVNRVICVILLVVSLLLGWRAFSETLILAWQSDENTYILLVLPIALVMIYRNLRIFEANVKWSRKSGVASWFAIIAGILCLRPWYETALPDQQLSLQMLLLVASWAGIVILCLGMSVARVNAFPLFLLFGLVPLPQDVLEWLISGLQIWSACAAHALYSLIGVPVIQQGVFLTIPGVTAQVAQECSSIRSSSMLVLLSLVMAQITLHSFWRKALVVAVSIPLSIAKNGLRIFVITMLGTRVDPAYLNGRLHHQGGVIFFAVALGCTAFLLWLLQKSEFQAKAKALSVQTTSESGR